MMDLEYSTWAAFKILYIKVSHIYTTTLHLNHLDSFVQKRLIWFYAVLVWFDSLMMVPCGLKHVGIFSKVM